MIPLKNYSPTLIEIISLSYIVRPLNQSSIILATLMLSELLQTSTQQPMKSTRFMSSLLSHVKQYSIVGILNLKE